MMSIRAIILTIGDELTGGHTVDTNSSYLAGHLAGLGIRVSRLETVGDDLELIARQIGIALDAADLIFITGGLGPTTDDITKEAVALATGRKMVIDQGLKARLEARFKGHASATAAVVDSLASIPENSGILKNRAGAAAGILIEHRGAQIFVMPGVPKEMEAVFTDEILPVLERLPRAEITLTRVLRTTGMSESAIAARLEPVIDEIEARLGYLPRPEGVELRLTASGPEQEVDRVLSESSRIIVAGLGVRVYSTDDEDINFVTGRMLIERGVTIAVAESCTGGLISHLLTQVPGISAVLERSVVSYSNRSKTDSLGVPAALIQRHGAASAEVAGSMACGVREIAGTDLGLSTTGIAGPGGGSEEKPVGLVYFGLAGEGLAGKDRAETGRMALSETGRMVFSETDRMVFRGSRDVVKLKAAVHGLELVRCRLLGKEAGTGG